MGTNSIGFFSGEVKHRIIRSLIRDLITVKVNLDKSKTQIKFYGDSEKNNRLCTR